jgi:NDP-mannose synthase
MYFPNPLVPLGDTPVLELLTRRLIATGCANFTLTHGYLAELMCAYFDRRKCLNDLICLNYVEEQELTVTAGSLVMVA